MHLHLNASENTQTIVTLVIRERAVRSMAYTRDFHESEKLLPAIDRLLQSEHLTPRDLDGIVVIRGPGSFTAIRLSVTVANTLGQTLGVPVAGIKAVADSSEQEMFTKGVQQLKRTRVGDIVEPYYGKLPNITKRNS